MRTFDLVMPKTKIPRSEFEHRTEIEGLREFQRALRFADKDTKKMVKQGSKAIATHVVKVMRVRAMRIRHREQYEMILPSIRAVQGSTPRIRVGGKRRAKVTPMYPSGNRRRDKVYAGDVLMGLEFGGTNRKYTGTKVFVENKRYGGKYVYGSKQIEKALKRLGN